MRHSTHARRAAAARAAARAARARGVAAAATSRCRARTRASGARRATPSSTAFPSAELAEAEHVDASLRIQADRQRERAGRRRPGAAGPRRARAARRCASCVLQRRWAITLWPTAGRRPAGRRWARRTSRRSSSARCSWTATTRSRPGASCATFQARLIERLAPAREIRIEAPGTDLTLERRGPHLGQLRRQAQHAVAARSSPARTRTPPRAAIRFTIPTVAARRRRRGRDARVPRGPRGRPRSAERGDAYLQATLDTDDGARILGELGIGTNFGIDRPIGAILFDEKIGGTVHLALGKLLSGDRRHQRVRRALGPDLRPAPGRAR